VIIPTYNEEHDIAETIDHVLAQSSAACEVIIVDGGSSDSTLDRIAPFARDGRLIVIEEGRRRGVAAARNAGIRRAQGDVLVFLNADVLLPPDFIERLAALYAGDVDLVSVESRVANLGDATGRFMHAEHLLDYGPTSVGWSEGFSCRRDAALGALFPEEIPGAGGEDVEFVQRLLRGGNRWRVDYSIEVAHRVPATLVDFWRQFAGRGRAVPHIERGVRRRGIALVTTRRTLAAARSLIAAAMLLPNAVRAYRLAQRSPEGLRDVATFWLLLHLRIAAHRIGEWQSLIEMARARKSRSR
jgi:glycosyltransferase involved in cell wall biosynthesis